MRRFQRVRNRARNTLPWSEQGFALRQQMVDVPQGTGLQRSGRIGNRPQRTQLPLADGTEAYASGAADDPPGVVSQPETHNPDTATASNRGVMRDFRCWRRVISRLSKNSGIRQGMY